MTVKKLITIKINGGNPVVLCEKCRTIISYLKDLPSEYANLELISKSKAQYCKKCNRYIEK